MQINMVDDNVNSQQRNSRQHSPIRNHWYASCKSCEPFSWLSRMMGGHKNESSSLVKHLWSCVTNPNKHHGLLRELLKYLDGSWVVQPTRTPISFQLPLMGGEANCWSILQLDREVQNPNFGSKPQAPGLEFLWIVSVVWLLVARNRTLPNHGQNKDTDPRGCEVRFAVQTYWVKRVDAKLKVRTFRPHAPSLLFVRGMLTIQNPCGKLFAWSSYLRFGFCNPVQVSRHPHNFRIRQYS